MRLGHRAHKLPLIRPHDTSGGQVVIQDLPDQRLSRLASIISNLLSWSAESGLGWAIWYCKDHRLKGGHTLWRWRDSISIFGYDTEVELLLRLFGHREAQRMTYWLALKSISDTSLPNIDLKPDT